MDDTYRTVCGEGQAEFTERRSRFIGCAKPVVSEEEASGFIRSIRERNREANHNVYAYSLRAGQAKRYSDDGEPQGTAGIPVLDVLLRSGVTDCAVVVTRYFGGVLLGAGGLVRAYSHAASLALEAAGKTEMSPCIEASLFCAYDRYGRVLPLIAQFGGEADGETFAEGVTVRFHLPCETFVPFQAAFTDATFGRGRLEQRKKKYYPLRVKI